MLSGPTTDKIPMQIRMTIIGPILRCNIIIIISFHNFERKNIKVAQIYRLQIVTFERKNMNLN